MENQPQPVKDLIPKVIQNLSENPVGKKSQNPETEPIYYLPEKEAHDYLKEICLGSIYLNWDPFKIALREQLEILISDFKKNRGKGTIISGTLGSGKTTLLHYLAHRILTELPARHIGYFSNYENRYILQSLFPPKRILMCRTSRLITYLMDRNDYQIEALQTCEVLMLDDFARHYSADYPLSKLEDFIESRYAFQRPTFVTLDVPLSVMAEKKEWASMVDRFRDSKWMTGALTMTGKSQRN